MLGVVVPHGVLFRGGAEGRIREAMLKADLIEAVIGLAPNLFYGAGIPAAILIIRKTKPTDPVRSEKLMTALDAVDGRFGRGTLRPGGIRPVTPWSTRANNRSPRYTTRFSDLMEVVA